MKFKITDRVVFGVFLVLWGVLCLILNPIADFPLNDDWSYAYAVKSLAVDGNLEYRGWMSMTLIAQVWWGSAFVKIFGFSFTVLRFSTLILAFFGSFFTYKLFDELRVKRNLALLFAIVITLNPIFLNLSFTFMTDVPFYALSIISIYFFVRYINTNSLLFFWIGIVAMIFSILIRQLGLAIPMALMVVAIQRKHWIFIVPIVVGAGTFLLYQWVIPNLVSDLGRGNELNLLLWDRITSRPFGTILDAFKRTAIFFVYFGLLFAPILIFLHTPKGKYVDWVWLAFAAIGTYILYRVDFLMPLNKNILIDFGVGPRTLYDTWVSKETDLRAALLLSRLQLTFVGMIFGLKVLEACFDKIFRLKKASYQLVDAQRFIVLVGVFYLIPIMSVDNFDRYYLLLFPIVIIMISNHLTVRRTVWKGIQWVFMTTVLCTFTLLSNSYYLSWNRARWQGIEYLTEELKIPRNKIDGGFEYNGWYNYNPDDFKNGVENMWVPDDSYRICFEEIDGYEVIKEYEYIEWLRLGKKRTIKVLKKVTQASSQNHPIQESNENIELQPEKPDQTGI